MYFWEIVKGNTEVEEIPLYDNQGELVTNLSLASAVKFQIKTERTGTPLVSKSLGDGIEVDQPEPGYIRLTLSATDTDLDPGFYVIGLQIEWNDEIKEIEFLINNQKTRRLRILQDVVNA